jgi:hypothetical protein
MEVEEQVIVCIDGTLAHYWDIDSSNGTMSKGTCRKCSKIKRFKNSTPISNSWRERGEKHYAGGRGRSK